MDKVEQKRAPLSIAKTAWFPRMRKMAVGTSLAAGLSFLSSACASDAELSDDETITQPAEHLGTASSSLNAGVLLQRFRLLDPSLVTARPLYWDRQGSYSTPWQPLTTQANGGNADGSAQYDGVSPGAVSWDHRDRIDTFWVRWSDRTVVHYATGNSQGIAPVTAWATDNWGKPTPSGGSGVGLYGTMGVTSGGPNRVDIFSLYAGNFATRQIWRKQYANGTFYPWTFIANAPAWGGYGEEDGLAAASWGPNRQDIFVKVDGLSGFKHYATDNNGSTWASDNWPTFASFGGALHQAKATSWGDRRLDVFAIGFTAGFPIVHASFDHDVWVEESWGTPCTDPATIGRLRGADSLPGTVNHPQLGTTSPTVTVVVACLLPGNGSAGARVFRATTTGGPPTGWIETTQEPVGKWSNLQSSAAVTQWNFQLPN